MIPQLVVELNKSGKKRGLHIKVAGITSGRKRF
jgi:hypothetical protein